MVDEQGKKTPKNGTSRYIAGQRLDEFVKLASTRRCVNENPEQPF
jgi:hypothetical protein